MTERFVEQLSRFTPDGTGLDRDALLFAAGRASARPARPWKIATGLLAASQLLTLVLLWPHRDAAPPGDSPTAPTPSPTETLPEPAPEATPREPDTAGSLLLVGADEPSPRPIALDAMVPPEPPLHAFAPPPPSLLN